MFKKVLRYFVVDTFSLWAVSQLTTGMQFEDGLRTFLLASGALTLASILGKPVINIMLLPLNLVTFGLFKWVSSAIALYLVTLVVPGFNIVGFYFEGFFSKWIDIPNITLSGILAYVAFAFFLSVISSAIHWLNK